MNPKDFTLLNSSIIAHDVVSFSSFLYGNFVLFYLSRFCGPISTHFVTELTERSLVLISRLSISRNYVEIEQYSIF